MAKAPADIRSLARAHTETALRTLWSIAEQKSAPASARVAAAQALLDRGWGKPTQPIEGTENPIELVHKIERVIVSATGQPGWAGAAYSIADEMMKARGASSEVNG